MQRRKSLFILSALGCVFLCSSVFAAQSGDFTYSVSGSDNVTITGYTGSGGVVVIPDTIDGMPVVNIGYMAFYECSGLTSVTIPNSVTSLGAAAFAACYHLTSVTLGNGLTSLDGEVFAACSKLTSVTIPNSVTSIGVGMFYNCTSLTNVKIGSGVTSIYLFGPGMGAFGAFEGCTSLTSVYFYGNAPTNSGSSVNNYKSSFTVYYLAGATGFTNPWYGFPTAVFSLPDADVDGIPDVSDNCPNVYNPLQLDADTDGIGDVCDTTPGCGGCGQAACEAIDTDGDGIQNYVDNCPKTANPQQKDADADGIGDVCDTTPGCGGGCGQPVCEGSADTDGDYVRDAIDNCPSVFNPNQLDANGNGTGDCCDTTPDCGGVGQPVCDDFCSL